MRSKIYLSLRNLIEEIELSPSTGESLRSSLSQLYYLRKVTISFSNLQLDRGDAESEPHPVDPILSTEEVFDLLRLLSERGAKLSLY